MHPLIRESEVRAEQEPWVEKARARVRDQGHVFHVEMFVVPVGGRDVGVDTLRELREALHAVDWKIHDVVVVPVRSIPGYLQPRSATT